MLHDVKLSELLTMGQAAALLPAVNGKPPSRKTVLDWAKRGYPTPQGRVRLETVKVGRWRVTTEEALRRFFRELERRDGPR